MVVDSPGNESTERMTSACRDRSLPPELLVGQRGASGLCQSSCNGFAQLQTEDFEV
jgi:hypothetical protein